MQQVRFLQSYRTYAEGETARFDKDYAERLKDAGIVEFITKKGAQ